MSRIESGYVPLPKVEQEQPEDNIEIRLNLPAYVDQDRIGVNLTQIAKLNHLGGIRRLSIVGKSGMDTSFESVGVVGINSDGTATASKKITRVSVPESVSHSRNSGWEPYSLSFRWKNVGVNVNLDEISQNLKESTEGVRSSSGWAKHLDKGIKNPIRTEGHRNLLHDLEIGDKIDYGVMVVALGSINAITYLTAHQLSPGAIIGFVLGNRTAAFLKFRKDPNYRFSCVPGYQLDRAAILSIQSRLRTVVKDLH